MPVPFIDLSRLTKEVSADVYADWKECLDKCEFVGGPRVGEVEKKLRGILNVPHAISCANGTDALIVGLQAVGVKRGSKVALPNLTFWATYEAVEILGATPILIDIDENDLQMSFSEFQKAYEAHKFDAALLVHLFGWASAQLSQFRAFCKEKGVHLVEDGAQCFGVTVNGEPVLSKAEIGTISFYPAKVIGGAMDGGAVTAQSEAHDKLLRSICNHGRSEHYSYAHIGWNSRMGGVQAAFLNRVLPLTEKVVASRKKAAEFYRKRLTEGSSRIRVYGAPAGVSENGYLSVATVEGKTGPELIEGLKAKGIGAGRVYPETMSVQPPAKNAIRFGSLERSTRFCERVVNLPLFYGITEAECEEAASALLSLVG